jgi:hypothetical protein
MLPVADGFIVIVVDLVTVPTDAVTIIVPALFAAVKVTLAVPVPPNVVDNEFDKAP